MSTNATRNRSHLFRGDTKWCASCASYLPLERFGRDTSKWHGLSSHCKQCKWQRDEGRRQYAINVTNCHYCGCNLNEATATVDHFVPRSSGGTNEPDNLVAACLTCNTTKKDHSIEGFRTLLERKRDGVPYFTRAQLSYLTSVGFEFPVSENRVRFWFETRGGE